jgi:hydroxyethylthiazole kinase-like uncharacterized protein yjeF
LRGGDGRIVPAVVEAFFMRAPIPDTYEGYRVVTPEQMREIDRRAIDEKGIPSLDLMESAGKVVAEEAALMLEDQGLKDFKDAMVTVCCGRGNNGGDGLVAARYLKSKGAEVMVFIATPKRDGGYTPEVQENLKRAAAAGVSVHQTSEELVELDVRLRSSALLIDALLGTGASGRALGPMAKMIQRMNRADKKVLSVDIPSGLDGTTGHHSGPVIEADVTCTLGLPKSGLLAGPAKRYVGRIKVCDIGFPKELLA